MKNFTPTNLEALQGQQCCVSLCSLVGAEGDHSRPQPHTDSGCLYVNIFTVICVCLHCTYDSLKDTASFVNKISGMQKVFFFLVFPVEYVV